ncbi:MAG: hypothetical protein Q4G03_07420 [Planctomycetia bacterium]|nr:hypothetical protein [Planctomycetia bacterium]
MDEYEEGVGELDSYDVNEVIRDPGLAGMYVDVGGSTGERSRLELDLNEMFEWVESARFTYSLSDDEYPFEFVERFHAFYKALSSGVGDSERFAYAERMLAELDGRVNELLSTPGESTDVWRLWTNARLEVERWDRQHIARKPQWSIEDLADQGVSKRQIAKIHGILRPDGSPDAERVARYLAGDKSALPDYESELDSDAVATAEALATTASDKTVSKRRKGGQRGKN